MAEEKDRIRRAAEALDALSGPGPQDKPAPPPAAPVPANEPPRPNQPAASPADSVPVPVALRRPGPLHLSRKPKAVEKVEPPPPPALTPLAKAMLARKVALRRTVIPVLLVSGLAMVLLGCWSISVLVLGRIPFEPDMQVDVSTRFFAKLSLLAWPTGAILLGGAIFLMYDVYQYYQTRQGQEPPGGTPKV